MQENFLPKKQEALAKKFQLEILCEDCIAGTDRVLCYVVGSLRQWWKIGWFGLLFCSVAFVASRDTR
jgi:hypothetical protein